MATKSITKRTPQRTHAAIKKLVVPDKLDLRDRAYQPRVASAPKEVLLLEYLLGLGGLRVHPARRLDDEGQRD